MAKKKNLNIYQMYFSLKKRKRKEKSQLPADNTLIQQASIQGHGKRRT